MHNIQTTLLNILEAASNNMFLGSSAHKMILSGKCYFKCFNSLVMCRGEMSFIFWLIIVGYSIYSVQCELTYLQTELNLAFLVNRVNIMSLVNPK